MILYIHEYNKNKIIVRAIESKETEKTFRVIDKYDDFPGYLKTLSKTKLGVCESRWSNEYSMVDLQPEVEKFKNFIKKHKENEIEALEQKLANAKKSLKEFETVDVVIKEVQKYDI